MDGFHCSIHSHMGNKAVGTVNKNAVCDFSVFQRFSPFSVQDSGAVSILPAKIQFHDYPAAFTVAEFLPDTPAPSGHRSSRKSPALRNPRDLPATAPLF